MKLRNKKTGEIAELVGMFHNNGRIFYRFKDEKGIFKQEVHSLLDLSERWEDYEEPKDVWKKMQAGEWKCACCYAYLEPIDSTHVICPRCGLRHRFKNDVIQTKGNMMKDYDE